MAFGLPRRPAGTPRVTEPWAREPIAIVGIGCRLPGGISDPDDLWKALLDARDCVVDIPGSRWDPKKFLDPTGRAPGRSYVQKAGMLTEDPKAFDAAFFGIPPREAAALDPQQRLLLQCTWEAFEDAGEPPGHHAGAQTGVFIGGFMLDRLNLGLDMQNRTRISTHSATAGTLTMLSNRLSYSFDLRGPSVSLDTACSSSLVAIHQACQSIWSSESDAALAGGVNVLLKPETQITMAKGRFLSRTGLCQAFSEDADGYVRAEGAAVLLLKPLSAARRDGNSVHALILGTATNQDGRTNGITVPNGDAQIAVMRAAYRQARVEPSEVAYVEAHGTGTPVGDPIEANAIGTVVGAGRAGEKCPIGSIKTNIGHLEAGAGVAGVLKAAMCLKHGAVPPHLHLANVNPAIDLDTLNLENFLDTLGALRRRRGLPASVIQWGVLGETGIVARDATLARYLEQMGISAVNVDDALLGLREVIHSNVDRLTLVEADWSRLARIAMPMAGDRRIELLAGAEDNAKEAAEDVIKLFEGFSEEARHERVQSLLAKIVAGVLQMDETRFDFSQPLHEVGLDSIMALEIAAGIEKTLGLRLSAMDLAAGPSIETLATTIVGRLAGPPSDERAA
ncbi:beta-ketoacyl synthase N-terminal-like domain-containing protein [Mycobacterium sp.]